MFHLFNFYTVYYHPKFIPVVVCIPFVDRQEKRTKSDHPHTHIIALLYEVANKQIESKMRQK